MQVWLTSCRLSSSASEVHNEGAFLDVRGDAMAILLQKFLVQSQVTAVDAGIPGGRGDKENKEQFL